MSQTDTRGAGPSGLRWCALCRAEYVVGVLECAQCEVTLVDAPPLTPEEVGDEEGQQLAYELADVDATERLAIDRELAERGVVHSWDGTTLVVAPWDEADVDAVLGGDEDDDLVVEEGLDLDDEGEEHLVYDIADWDAERRAELAAQLEGEGIAHAFDEHGDLVVHVADEDRVDELLDAVEFPDQLDAGTDEVGALDAVETLGALFVACDRLKNDPTDSEGTIGAVDAARVLGEMGPPFGFDRGVWEGFQREAANLRELLEAESDVVDDDAVADAATRLRAALRDYV